MSVIAHRKNVEIPAAAGQADRAAITSARAGDRQLPAQGDQERRKAAHARRRGHRRSTDAAGRRSRPSSISTVTSTRPRTTTICRSSAESAMRRRSDMPITSRPRADSRNASISSGLPLGLPWPRQPAGSSRRRSASFRLHFSCSRSLRLLAATIALRLVSLASASISRKANRRHSRHEGEVS